MEFKHQLIICIVDEGYSDNVMDVAKECGATGGTVVHAKGTANKEAERYFNIAIQPNKEMVMILVPTAIRDKILHALYTKVGLDTSGHGIAFALPVDHTVGLSKPVPVPNTAEGPKANKDHLVKEDNGTTADPNDLTSKNDTSVDA